MHPIEKYLIKRVLLIRGYGPFNTDAKIKGLIDKIASIPYSVDDGIMPVSVWTTLLTIFRDCMSITYCHDLKLEDWQKICHLPPNIAHAIEHERDRVMKHIRDGLRAIAVSRESDDARKSMLDRLVNEFTHVAVSITFNYYKRDIFVGSVPLNNRKISDHFTSINESMGIRFFSLLMGMISWNDCVMTPEDLLDEYGERIMPRVNAERVNLVMWGQPRDLKK
jgi:hypothetical protein